MLSMHPHTSKDASYTHAHVHYMYMYVLSHNFLDVNSSRLKSTVKWLSLEMVQIG